MSEQLKQAARLELDVIIWQLDHWPDWLEEAIEARTMTLKKQGYK